MACWRIVERKAIRILAQAGAAFTVAVAVAASGGQTAMAADTTISDPGLADPGRFTSGVAADPAWSGFHIGLILGHSWGEGSARGGGPGGSGSFDGADAGVYAGYDRQVGPYVFGLEGDIAVSGADAGLGAAGVTLDQAWTGSLRARAGISLDQFLLYGTGGVAVAGVEATGGGLSDSAALSGWTVGAGAERILHGNISARVEYRYSDFGGETFTLGGGATEVEADSHSVRAGVGVRF